MTLEDRLLLIKAGYTKDEIEGMTGAPAPEPSVDPVPVESAPEQPTEPVPPPHEEKPGSSFDEVMLEIKKLKDAIAKQNIQDRVRDLPTSETADDILASILNPKKGK